MKRKRRRERECVKLAWKVLVLWQQKSHKKGKHLCWVRKLSRPPGPGKTKETTPKKRKGWQEKWDRTSSSFWAEARRRARTLCSKVFM